MNNELMRALTREIHAQANGPSAWGSLTELGRDHYYKRMIEAWSKAQEVVSLAQRPMIPAAPWPHGAENNAKIVGWTHFFKGGPRDFAPFPPDRQDLWQKYRVGWDMAAESKAYG
jgi:hypothetical protein